MKQSITKNYSIVVPGRKPVVIRQTTTWVHAVKHACYAAELKISVKVIDTRTSVAILEVPAIDNRHAVKPRCKRDKRYARLARKATV